MKNSNHRKLVFQTVIDYILKYGDTPPRIIAQRLRVPTRSVKTVLFDIANSGFLN